MNPSGWFIFTLTVFIATIIPGPSVLLALHDGILHGSRKSTATALGVVAAACILASLAMAGLDAVLSASAFWFRVIKYVGGIYLVYLGFRICFNRSKESGNTGLDDGSMDSRASALFFRGVMTGLGNPKALLFFSALFPQFLTEGNGRGQEYALMLVTTAGIVFICMMIYATGGRLLQPFVSKRNIQRWVNRVTGGVFATVGFYLILRRD